MKWLWDSMLGYWLLLLCISLGIAAAIYMIWLRGLI